MRKYRDLILLLEHLRVESRIDEGIARGSFKRQRQHDITAGVAARGLSEEGLDVRREGRQLTVLGNRRVRSMIRVGRLWTKSFLFFFLAFYWHISSINWLFFPLHKTARNRKHTFVSARKIGGSSDNLIIPHENQSSRARPRKKTAQFANTLKKILKLSFQFSLPRFAERETGEKRALLKFWNCINTIKMYIINYLARLYRASLPRSFLPTSFSFSQLTFLLRGSLSSARRFLSFVFPPQSAESKKKSHLFTRWKSH